MAIYYAGKMGSINFNGAIFPLDAWEFSSTTQTPEVSNFTIPFAQQAFIPNLVGGEVRASGPLTSLGTLNEGTIAARPNAGQYVVANLGVGPGLAYSVTCLVQEINTSQDIQSNAKVDYVLVVSPNPNLL